MTSKSRSFELLVGRILSLSRDSVANVICDDRVIDPDGEGRTRQVDITYKRNEALVHVECRDHKSPQDVQWIEELIGRRASLNPDIMIGVSSSGFTHLALKKAESHGIILRSVLSVTDDEILSWGCEVIITVLFIRFDCLNLVLSSRSKLLGVDFSHFWLEIVGRRQLGDWLSNIALQFKDLGRGETLPFIAKVSTPTHYLLNPILSKISEIEIHSFVTGVRQDFRMSSALVSSEEIGSSAEDTVVFGFGRSGTELHLSTGTFRWALDFSKILYPKDCFFSGEVQIDFGEPRPMDGVFIMGMDATKAPEMTIPIVRQQAYGAFQTS